MDKSLAVYSQNVFSVYFFDISEQLKKCLRKSNGWFVNIHDSCLTFLKTICPSLHIQINQIFIVFPMFIVVTKSWFSSTQCCRFSKVIRSSAAVQQSPHRLHFYLSVSITSCCHLFHCRLRCPFFALKHNANMATFNKSAQVENRGIFDQTYLWTPN